MFPIFNSFNAATESASEMAGFAMASSENKLNEER